MYLLGTIFPAVRRTRLPLTRDQLMMLMMAINLIFLGVDTYMAHNISKTIVPYEWIPILFGPIGGVLLLFAGWIALKNRPLATGIATLVLLTSAAVGLLGAYFHFMRAILPSGPAGQRVTIDLLVWAPPVLGPLMFAVIGILGLSAAWAEIPPDSGILVLPGERKLQLPYSKTRAYFYIIGIASLATVISSVLDHSRLRFDNPWLWLPTAVGVFGTVVAVTLGAIETPTRADLLTYFAAMVIMIATGLVGAFLHTRSDLTASGAIIIERFLSGAPILAPLLFCNVGLLGLLVLTDPREQS